MRPFPRASRIMEQALASATSRAPQIVARQAYTLEELVVDQVERPPSDGAGQ
jgi:hypothetical protein